MHLYQPTTHLTFAKEKKKFQERLANLETISNFAAALQKAQVLKNIPP
ncbi:MAG TPA: hypothetical protein VFC92_00225 [Bacteroidales bacterium]|nr:hypothetical protein [Bacteroidales bacterium]